MSEDRVTDIILYEIREHRKESAERHEKLSERVHTLEIFKSRVRGGFAVVCAIFGTLITFIVKSI